MTAFVVNLQAGPPFIDDLQYMQSLYIKFCTHNIDIVTDIECFVWLSQPNYLVSLLFIISELYYLGHMLGVALYKLLRTDDSVVANDIQQTIYVVNIVSEHRYTTTNYFSTLN